MNPVDKKIVLGVTIVGAVITMRYGFTEEKIIQVPGLDVKNTKKLIAAITVIGVVILVANEFKKSKSIA